MNRNENTDIRDLLAINVKWRRQGLRLNHTELAQRCGIDEAYLRDVEQAMVNTTAANLKRLASGLGGRESELVRMPPTDDAMTITRSSTSTSQGPARPRDRTPRGSWLGWT